MTTEPTHDFLRRYVDALVSRGDYGRFLTDDVRLTITETGDEVRGREAVVGFIDSLHAQMFDAQVEVLDVVSTDRHGVLEAVFVGTHVGEFAGLAPTGAKVRIPYAVVYDLTPDAIAALRVYLPISGLVAQLQEAASATAGR